MNKTLKELLNEYLDGTLDRDTDESYSEGVWDYAMNKYADTYQAEMYYDTIWGLFEYLKEHLDELEGAGE